MTWSILQNTVAQFTKEGKENNFILGAIYPLLTLFESYFGENYKAVEYFKKAIEIWAISEKLIHTPMQPSPAMFDNIDLLLRDNTDKNYEFAGNQALNLVFLPMFVNWITTNVTIAKIKQLLNFWLINIKPELRSINDWEEIFNQVLLLIQTWKDGGNLDELKLPQIESKFEFLLRLLKSVSPRYSLNEILGLQLSIVIFLIDNRLFSDFMSQDVDNFIYSYWEGISRTQRFALRNPDLFQQELVKIPPDLGINSLVSIIKCVSRALGIKIPPDVLIKLNL